MRLAVVGGTGDVGALVAAELAARGDQVRILSRRRPGPVPVGSTYRRIDLTTGEGLAAAVDGIDAVIDAANNIWRPAAVLIEGTRRLLESEAAAGVGHHVGISIVGCDRVPAFYYRAKVAQEQLVSDAPIAWSLLRTTQFHTFLARLLAAAARLRVVPTGEALLQPIDPVLVARHIADAVHAGPGGRLPNLAGPEVSTLSELGETWRSSGRHRLLSLRLPLAGRIGHALCAGALCDRHAATAGPTFAQWLRSNPPE